jgi:hypothetical protein
MQRPRKVARACEVSMTRASTTAKIEQALNYWRVR